ncbi:MAG: hypothetical protein M0011_07850 [Elusimicrobia bacterium]|nr:hypothetical protein [Elusimicrobiota bacterium]
MKLVPEGRSRVLSYVSLAVAAACAVMASRAAYDLLTLAEVLSTPAFYLSLVHSTLPIDLPPLAALMVRHTLPFFVFMLLFWSSGLGLSIGVLARREWARRGAVWMLYLNAAAALLVLGYPWLAVPRPLMYGDIPLAPDFNGAVRTAAFFLRLTSMLHGGLCLWGGLALDRGSVRSEFD